MKTLITYLLVFTSFCLIAQEDEVRHEYNIKDGKLDSTFTSYYADGTKKAEGRFNANMRSGVWSFWDKEGSLCLRRDYSNSFEFEKTYPRAPKDPTAKLLSKPRYKLTRNEDGFYDYFFVRERMVKWAIREWRWIDSTQFPELFKNDEVVNSIIESYKTDSLKLYSTKDDEFREILDTLAFDLSALKIIGYRLKEDCFVDTDRFIMESRPIGLCPIAINDHGDTTELFWAYYPTIREGLSEIKVNDADEKIESVCDLIFFRKFSSTIERFSSYWYSNEDINLEKIKSSNWAMEAELYLLNKEHDFLLFHSQKKK